MEILTNKPFKTPSNISEMVSKLAKVCKLRSIGVFPSENPTPDTDPVVETPNETNHHHEIKKLFAIVSALKSAYVQLQEAHVPHNPKLIVEADELVVAELEALYNFRRAYLSKSKLTVSPLRAEIEANEITVAELKSRDEAKSSEIVRLGRELEELASLDLSSLIGAFEAASNSIHDFAKPLIALMKESGWDLDLAAESIVREAVYSQRSHKKYAFEAYISRRMFDEISLKTRDFESVMRFRDPIEALTESPESDFAKFCLEKYPQVVHRAMETSFFGNSDHRELVLCGKHPRTPFYRVFATMAKWVWVLQGIASSLCPKAKAFRVDRRSDFSDEYMESVAVSEPTARVVEFMVMPGFKIGGTIVKSRVYVSKPRD